MERVAATVATAMGTVSFVVISTVLIVLWLAVNGGAGFVEQTLSRLAEGRQFDPPEWIGLNLIFSAVAFYTGALILIAERARAQVEHKREEAEAKHREEIAEEHGRRLAAIEIKLDHLLRL